MAWPGRIGGVQYHGVAWIQAFQWEALQYGGDCGVHGAQVHGCVEFTESHRVAICIVDGTGAIAAVLDVGGIARAYQRRRHLVGDGVQSIAHHFQGDRISCSHSTTLLNKGHSAPETRSTQRKVHCGMRISDPQSAIKRAVGPPCRRSRLAAPAADGAQTARHWPRCRPATETPE